MLRVGTKQRKTAARAAPPPLDQRMPAGCVAMLVVYLGTCLSLLASTKHLLFLAMSAPGLIVVAYALARSAYGVGLLVAARVAWAPRGIRGLMVHSRSPVWEMHIRTSWVPLFGQRVASLNWSERASWRSSLAVRLFNHFCRRDRNFNPAVLVFRGLRRPLVFRFFYAFHEAADGRPQYLQELEGEMLGALGVARAA